MNIDNNKKLHRKDKHTQKKVKKTLKYSAYSNYTNTKQLKVNTIHLQALSYKITLTLKVERKKCHKLKITS